MVNRWPFVLLAAVLAAPVIAAQTRMTLVRSVRAAHRVAGVIEAEQPNFPAEVARNTHSDSDWLQMARIASRTATEITSVRVGWAYALPAGLEFHQSEAIAPPGGGILPGGAYETGDLRVAPRADTLDLVTFVEQVTLKNGMVLNADHAQISAFYKDCCTGRNAGKQPQPPQGRVQPNMPGGVPNSDGKPTPGLKPIAFDVVSFRQVKQDQNLLGLRTRRKLPDDGDFISYHASSVDDLLMFAYAGASSGPFTISGEPDWVKNDLYDFTAKVAPEDVEAWKNMQLIDKRAMVQRVLEEALKLKVHEDTSMHPVYDLVVAKGGPKLMDYHAGDTVTPPFPSSKPTAGPVLLGFNRGNLVAQDATMADLVGILSRPNVGVGREVIDNTGLKGTYDFDLLMPHGEGAEQLEDAGVPSVFEGLKELGLQLVPSKGPNRGMVIDHVERPQED
jgi:uncharacterized protein (TIGR03435 family)